MTAEAFAACAARVLLRKLHSPLSATTAAPEAWARSTGESPLQRLERPPTCDSLCVKTISSSTPSPPSGHGPKSATFPGKVIDW
eukprot:CAMPEP_0169460044 /NCGR_PEP_ID=MMETSP1042-20121227/18268_1 /TAXON_ID=464988 /ORGANISM="Hemiselmis andersenii, Strain CCMP1180" /LENGTH=83 /DNA_ID=CAMNT_0009572491 /DNA_START=29 /DNA_END=280 /DNA_ORIENTATION=-